VLAHISSSGRLKKAGVVAIVLTLFVGGFAMLSWPSAAQEQNVRPRALLDPRRLLDLFFRRGGDEQPPAMRQRRPVKAKAAKQRSKSRTQPPSVAEPESIAKLDTARTVMVVGDFMAGGLAQGLDVA
jgi:uncharacterized protein